MSDDPTADANAARAPGRTPYARRKHPEDLGTGTRDGTKFLRDDGTWQTSSSGMTDPTTTKGDLIVHGAATARFAVGSDGQVLTADSTQTAGVKWAGGGGGLGVYGDGSDGAVTISGAATLGRDMFYDTLTVQNGGTLNTNGFRVYVKTSVTVNSGGVISGDGNAASGGTAGAITNIGTTNKGNAGGAGNTTAGTSGGGASSTLGGGGGAGGASGANGGGAGGIVSAPGATSGSVRSIFGSTTGFVFGTGGQNSLAGGAGGGGGGGDGTNKGGGGGGGAGVVVLVGKAIVNNGTISAKGGAGANGVAGNAGGGGGGGGGTVLLTYGSFTGNAATASGGAAGLHVGTGSDGSVGSVGTVITLLN